MENQYIIERFTDSNAKYSPLISVDNQGGFNFGAGFINKNSLQKMKGLELFYLKKGGGVSAVGFKFAEEISIEAMKLMFRGEARYFKSNSFWSKYSLNPENFSDKYEPGEYIDENIGKIYTIELKDKTKSL